MGLITFDEKQEWWHPGQHWWAGHFGWAGRITSSKRALASNTSLPPRPPPLFLSPPHPRHAPEWIEKRTNFARTIFLPFSSGTLFFFSFFFFLLRQSLIFLLFGLLCHFHFVFFISTDILPDFLLWKGGRCLPGNDRVPLPVSKGIQETRERRTQLESSQAQRGKARKEAWLPKKRGFAETGKPRENRYILESRILKMKEYKNVCVQEKKN